VEKTIFCHFHKTQKLKSLIYEKKEFVMFFTKPQKLKSNTRKNSFVIDFHNIKKIKLSYNLNKKIYLLLFSQTTKIEVQYVEKTKFV